MSNLWPEQGAGPKCPISTSNVAKLGGSVLLRELEVGPSLMSLFLGTPLNREGK